MNILGGHNYTYYPLDKFSDQTANEKLETHERELKKVAGASLELLRERLLETAQAARGSTEREKRLDAALAYLVLAKHEAFGAGKTVNAEQADVSAVYYHFAANELRQSDLLERSAQCYFNSALRAFDVSKKNSAKGDGVKRTLELGLRSAGRAKAQFSDLGEEEKSDEARALRLDIKRLRSWYENDLLRCFVLAIWGGVTRYGTSPRRWTIFFILSIMVFSCLYGYLLGGDGVVLAKAHNGLDQSGRVWAAIFLAFINLFAFGAYTNFTPQSGFGQMVVIAHALTAFVLVGTGVTFLTKR